MRLTHCRKNNNVSMKLIHSLTPFCLHDGMSFCIVFVVSTGTTGVGGGEQTAHADLYTLTATNKVMANLLTA